MKTIFSFNVNGIRSAAGKGLVQWIQEKKPDIICFQEIKANVEDIPLEIRDMEGYHTFWKPADKKGYSGVGVMSRVKPNEVVNRFPVSQYDAEGRLLLLDFGALAVMSAYFPSGTTGDVRQTFKEQFLEDFLMETNRLKKLGKRLIITGDVNICHKAIDIHNPVSNKNSSGFLPQEREWFDRFLASGFTDAFRNVNTEPHHYTWWSFRAGARARNLGWRIDYHLVDNQLKDRIQDYRIHSEIMMSDHCPIELKLDSQGLF